MMVGEHFRETECVFNSIFLPILELEEKLLRLYIYSPNPVKSYRKTFQYWHISQEAI